MARTTSCSLTARLTTLGALTATALAQSASLDRSTWQAEANVTNPTQECTYYSVPAVTSVLTSYPPIWANVNLSFSGLLPADRAIFKNMNSSIPNIAPRGTPQGDFTGVTYDIAGDPDCWWTDTKCTTPKLAGLPADISTCPEPNTWGFTLDDGPNCSHNAYYDYLNSIEQKATLFYIGSNVADWPLEAQRGLGEGHEICAHTWSHPYMTSMTNEQAFGELYFSKKIIHDVLGITVTCWRPPFGDVDDRIRYIANQLGMKTVIWDADTFDYEHTTLGVSAVEANYNALLQGAANGTYASHGTVVLSHELDNETMALSQQYLPQLQKAFTGGVMPVGACQNWTQIYGESGFSYPNYAEYIAGTRTIALPTPTAVASGVPLASGSIVTSTGLPKGASSISPGAAVTATGSAGSGAGKSSGAASVGWGKDASAGLVSSALVAVAASVFVWA